MKRHPECASRIILPAMKGGLSFVAVMQELAPIPGRCLKYIQQDSEYRCVGQ